MTALTMDQVYALAYAELGDKIKAIRATAIAFAESGGRPDAVGDVALQTSTWGPSVGLWQVRSLNAQRGTGGPRDATRLTDPRFNAHSMAVISNGGQSFSAWSTWTNGAFGAFLPAATKAAEKVGGNSGSVLGTIGGALSGAAGAAGDVLNPFGVVGKAADLAGSVTGFLGNLVNPHFWVRVVMVFGGMAALVVGALLLKGDLTSEALGALTGSAKGAALGSIATKAAAAAV